MKVYKTLIGNPNYYKHGFYGTRFYRIWQGMKTRCSNPKHVAYHRYGGRGITYDPKWEKFENFKRDMFPTYKEPLTIDRINNDGNYCKENCRWVSVGEQGKNTSHNRVITYKGKTKTLVEWSKEIGGSKNMLHERLRHGWSLERALTPPLFSRFNARKVGSAK